jgi:hypothetical protein
MKWAALAAAALILPSAVMAQDAPICTDRPTKANSPCTVPKGKVQVESGLVGWSLTKARGQKAELLTVGSSVAKIGLSERSDLQIGVTPYVVVNTSGDGLANRLAGFGDIVIRYKHRLTEDGSALQASIIPFVKVPTARRGIGNGKLEGGIALPVSMSVADSVTLTVGPEADVLLDADGRGRHLAIVNLVNLGVAVAPSWTASAELWTNLNFDPGGRIDQASADVAVAHALSNAVQIDLGANLGLTSATPDLEIYAGLSFRF